MKAARCSGQPLDAHPVVVGEEEYRAYMRRTGRFLPRLRAPAVRSSHS